MFDIITSLQEQTSLMTAPEVAKILNVGPGTITRLVKQGRIPSFLIGGKRLFDPAQMARWVESKSVKVKPAPAKRAAHPKYKEYIID